MAQKPSSETREARMKMLQEILPPTVNDIHMAIVDLDITMLSVADILRNIHRTFPPNSSMRNKIADGKMAVAVLCKSDLIKPYRGMIIMVTAEGSDVEIRSKEYIVLGVSEQTIANDDKILDMLDSFTSYLIKNYARDIPAFEKFYTIHVYDAFEMEDD